MLFNFFKTAWRNILRHRSYTLINIIGLGTGIAVCLVIFVLISFHLSFDNFHSKKDRIYRILTEYHHQDSPDIFYGPGISPAVPWNLKNDIPELQEVAPVFKQQNSQVQVINASGQTLKKFKEPDGVFVATPSLFKIFDFPLLAGSAASLKDPNAILLSKEVAEKYFGSWQAAMGRNLKWNNTDVVKVTGILATVPKNTDLQLKLVISFGTGSTKDFLTTKNWDGSDQNYGCYILVPEGMTEANITARLRSMIKKHHTPENKDSEVAQPLVKVHFDSKAGDFSNLTISPKMIQMLWLIALFILIIACVNFINLATAQAVNRAREVGVRKVLGSNKNHLMLLFLSETLIIVLVAIVLAIALSAVAIPYAGKILDLPLTASLLLQFKMALYLVILVIGVTLLAGFYPALVLSGFNPINALKSKVALKTNKGLSLRRSLVVLQFIVAQGLIICTVIIVKQMNYFTQTNMGFVKDAIVTVPFPTDSASLTRLSYLKTKLSAIQGINAVSFSSNIPATEENNWSTFVYDHAAKQTDFYAITKFADDQFVNLYKLKLEAGRNLLPSDTMKEFLINEALTKKLGLAKPEDALNKQLVLWGRFKGQIVGILKNYHNRSLRNDDAPMLITTANRIYNIASIKLNLGSMAQTIPAIEKVWNQVYPDYTFEYQFLDDNIANFYRQENQLASIYKCFAAIAILLSCLGLYGLASFMAVQRVKEVGIRKVLGATVGEILYLFSKEFIVLIGIAFLVVSPVTWYLMNKWLQDYTFRIKIHPGIYLLSAGMAICIAMATVSAQLIRAARANPVKSLKASE